MLVSPYPASRTDTCPVPPPLSVFHDPRTKRTSIPPEIIRRPYSRLSFYPRRIKRVPRLPVDIVAHHGKARWEILSLEELCKSQDGVVLRHGGAEGAEF